MSTGFRFLDTNNQDFVDFSDIFVPGTTNITTKFVTSSGKDLGELFASGTSDIVTNYHYTATDGVAVDLGLIFQPLTSIVYKVEGLSFRESISSGINYTLTFSVTGTGSIQFFQNVTKLDVELVGGGAGGRGSGMYETNDYFGYIGGVGGGGASSIRCMIGDVIPSTQTESKFYLTIGAGGTNGTAGSNNPIAPPQDGNPGVATVVKNAYDPSKTITAYGGNASSGIITTTSSKGDIYILPGAAVSENATSSYDNITGSSVGGFSAVGGGIKNTGTGTYISATGGNPSGNATGTLLYGGGGGPVLNNASQTNYTTSGAIVTINNNAGEKGIFIEGSQLTYLDGNQEIDNFGETTRPGAGGGGGGGGYYWAQSDLSLASFGKGGIGGDGILIIRFTFETTTV